MHLSFSQTLANFKQGSIAAIILYFYHFIMAAGDITVYGSAIPVSDSSIYVDSNVTLAKDDLVNVQAGQLEVADAGEKIAGVVKTDATSSSELVEVDANPFIEIVMDSDDSGILATDVYSSLFDITGGTGAQIVDTSTRDAIADGAGTGQLICSGRNPQGVRPDLDSDTSYGLFRVHEHQFAQN